MRHARRAWLGALCALALTLGSAAPAAQAAFDDPLFVVRPAAPPLAPLPAPPLPPLPPPAGTFEGPCGIAVDGAGGVYVSDYYHGNVDFFGAGFGPAYPYGYSAQIKAVDPVDGPCALALDGAGRLYVNDFHRNVTRFATSPFDAGTVIAGAPLDSSRPTGVAADPGSNDVYVDERTRIAVYDSSGTELGQIGAGSLEDGYGIARSGFPATAGLLYVPDAASDTVKVYEPMLGSEVPVAVIDGADTPSGHFTSLRNAAVAIDDSSGEIYVTDVLRPEFSELAETAVYVFDAAGAYEGRLKYSLENALPPGLAVDNSASASQGRVYVTTGNTAKAAVYVYPPSAATAAAVPLSGSTVLAPRGEDALGGGGFRSAPAATTLSAATAEGGTTPFASAAAPTQTRHRRTHHRLDRHQRRRARR